MTDTYDNLPTIEEYLKKYSITAKKSFGQNFLTNLSITDRIAKSIPNIKEQRVVEIGAGPGSLTRAILKNEAKKVIAIEIDNTALQIQSEIKEKYKDRLDILNQDALSLKLEDYKDIAEGGSIYICGNLPYNISVPLLINWLHIIYESIRENNKSIISGMTLMFQKEVSNRILSTDKSKNKKDYSRISVLSNWLCNTEKLFDLPPKCFTPAPKVVSSVMRLTPYEKIRYTEEYNLDIDKLEITLKQLFTNRRKMIRGLLKNINWDNLRIESTRRPEELTIKEICELSTYM